MKRLRKQKNGLRVLRVSQGKEKADVYIEVNDLNFSSYLEVARRPSRPVMGRSL